MRPEMQQAVLQSLRDPQSLVSSPPAKLDLTLRLLRRLRLLAYVGVRLQATDFEGLPPAAVDQLRSAVIGAEARGRLARWELDRILRALGNDRPRPLIVLKGAAYLLAQLPNARGRSFADVDLLVAREAVADLERRLRGAGWVGVELTDYDERFYRVWGHEIPPLSHPERGVEVDVHHQLLRTASRHKPDPAALRAAAREAGDSGLHVLAPIDMTLHAMVHLFHGGEIADALRELVDVHELLQHFAASEPRFWTEFWPRARQLGLTRQACYGLRYAQQLLGTAVPEDVLAEARHHGPGFAALRCMDFMVPQALFAPHPDREPPLARRLSLQVLYLRSHWVRMPPGMLLRHLSHKLVRGPLHRLWGGRE